MSQSEETEHTIGGDVEEIARRIVSEWRRVCLSDPGDNLEEHASCLVDDIASALRSERTASSARERVLVEALKPFCRGARRVRPWRRGRRYAGNLTLGDLRAARQALSTQERGETK